MDRQFLLALLLCGFAGIALSQTTGAPATEWIPPPIRCYHCDNEQSNDDCNGAGQPNNGTLDWCDPSLEDPTCFWRVKLNNNGDGWAFQKGCMKYDDCKDEVFSQFDDPYKISCFGHERWYNPPPIPSTECAFCCWKSGDTWAFDACNGWQWPYFTSTDPAVWSNPVNHGVNNWDHNVDCWEGHEKSGYSTCDSS